MAREAQIRRAWPSVLCNAGEAQHRIGRKRNNRLDDAMGESRETHSALRYAERCGFVSDAAEVARVIDQVDKVTATLYKLAHRPPGNAARWPMRSEPLHRRCCARR
jgi:four helix bundle protein